MRPGHLGSRGREAAGSDRRSVGGSRAGVMGGKEKEKQISEVCSMQALHRVYFKYHAEKGAVLAGVGFEIHILNPCSISTANIS